MNNLHAFFGREEAIAQVIFRTKTAERKAIVGLTLQGVHHTKLSVVRHVAVMLEGKWRVLVSPVRVRLGVRQLPMPDHGKHANGLRRALFDRASANDIQTHICKRLQWVKFVTHQSRQSTERQVLPVFSWITIKGASKILRRCPERLRVVGRHGVLQ